MTTAFALTSALTFPFGPTVRLWLRSSILPSTLPSTYKSSDPDNSPLITTDLPMCAPSPVCGASMLWPPSSFALNVRELTDCKSSAQLRLAGGSEIILIQELTLGALERRDTNFQVCYHRRSRINVHNPVMAISISRSVFTL